MGIMRAANIKRCGEAAIKAAVVMDVDQYRFQHCNFPCNSEWMPKSIESPAGLSLIKDKELLD
jgi:hypothetical protein